MSSASAERFSRALDVDFGLEDWDQASLQDRQAHIELLVDDGVDPFAIGQLHDRAHLRAEHALGDASLEQAVKAPRSAS